MLKVSDVPIKPSVLNPGLLNRLHTVAARLVATCAFATGLFATGLFGVVPTASAQSQTYPSQPIKIVIGYAAGGAAGGAGTRAAGAVAVGRGESVKPGGAASGTGCC